MLPKRRGRDSSDPCILPSTWWRSCATCCGARCQWIVIIGRAADWASLSPESQTGKTCWCPTSTTRRRWCRYAQNTDTLLCHLLLIRVGNELWMDARVLSWHSEAAALGKLNKSVSDKMVEFQMWRFFSSLFYAAGNVTVCLNGSSVSFQCKHSLFFPRRVNG